MSWKCSWPDVRDPSVRQAGGRIAWAATVGLPAAARTLGISPEQAGGLAVCGAFPCAVIETSCGLRVPTAALSQVLPAAPARRGCARRPAAPAAPGESSG